jgi:hypothetical protein
LGGGGGALGPANCPYGPAGGDAADPCCPGKGDVMGATLGVDLLGGALLTRGTSFQFSLFFALDRGGSEGVVDEALGGPPIAIGGGAATLP